jgi:hypothetical protein
MATTMQIRPKRTPKPPRVWPGDAEPKITSCGELDAAPAGHDSTEPAGHDSLATLAAAALAAEEAHPLTCNLCHTTFETSRGLSIHKAKMHPTTSAPAKRPTAAAAKRPTAAPPAPPLPPPATFEMVIMAGSTSSEKEWPTFLLQVKASHDGYHAGTPLTAHVLLPGAVLCRPTAQGLCGDRAAAHNGPFRRV